MTNCFFKTIFQVKLSYWLEGLYPRRLKQWPCRGHCHQLGSSISWKTLTMNMHSTVFNCATDEWLFQDLLSYWIKALFPEDPEEWTCRVFPSATNVWPFQDYIPNKISYILKNLSPRRPEKWMCSIFPGITFWVAFSRPSFQVKLSYWLEALSSRSSEQWMCRGFSSATDKWLFQDNLPRIALLIQKSTILGDLNTNHAVSFLVQIWDNYGRI